VAEESRLQNWWQTVPGILTAIAAIITAVAGLIVALQQTRISDTPSARQRRAVSATISAAPTQDLKDVTPQAAAATAADQAIGLPDGRSVTLEYAGSYRFRYDVLSAQRRSLTPDRSLLRFRVQVWTDFPAGVIFWSDSFRLHSGDLRLKPTNAFSQIVSRDETKEGDIEFEVDGPIEEASLAITYVSETRQLRIVMP